MAFLTMAFLRQPVATHGNGFGLFSPLPRASDLPLIAARCNHGLHKGSIPAAGRDRSKNSFQNE